ncbi:MAG: tetratricopeptide repeat protein [Myxococcales bacterium]|nr:tetratricopeptide repeat protein [Myxococcales bacterium]
MRAWVCLVACGLLLGCGTRPRGATVDPSERPVEGGGTPAAPTAKAEAAQPAAAADPGDSSEVRGVIAEGLEAAANGDQSTAAERFRAAIAMEPAAPQGHYNLGVLADWDGRYDEARQHYEAALRAEPTFGPAVLGVTYILVRRGDKAGAIAFAEQQLARAPQSLELRNVVNRVRLENGGSPDAVLRDTKQVLREDEKNVPAMITLATAYHQKGMFELAEAILKNAKELEPENPEIHSRLALAQQALGEKLKARLALEAATELPGGATAEVYNNLGLMYHEAGDYPGAEAQFRKALARWPDMLAAQVNLANALKGQQRFGDADAVLKAALERSPGSGPVLYNLGILYLDGSLPDLDAVQRLEQALAFFERYKQTSSTRAADDPVESYIEEARKKLEVERKRAEQMRKQPKAPPAEADGGDAAPADEAGPEADDAAADDDAAAGDGAADEAPADDAADVPVDEEK